MSTFTNEQLCHEVVICRARPGVSPTQVTELARELQRWVETQPGFLRRSLLWDEAQGTYIDLVTWQDRGAAERAAAAFAQAPCAAQIERVLEATGMQMFHAAEVGYR